MANPARIKLNPTHISPLLWGEKASWCALSASSGRPSLLLPIWWVLFGPGNLWFWASGASNLKPENARMVWIGRTLTIISSQTPAMVCFPIQTGLQHFPAWIKYALKEEIITEMRGNSPFVHREQQLALWRDLRGHRARLAQTGGSQTAGHLISALLSASVFTPSPEKSLLPFNYLSKSSLREWKDFS